MLKKAFQFFVYSSVNPQKISLTVKSVGVLLILLGGEQGMTDQLSEGVIGTIVALGVLFSQSIALFGLVRKIWLSIR